jgi:hypothetical protein
MCSKKAKAQNTCQAKKGKGLESNWTKNGKDPKRMLELMGLACVDR